MENTIKFNINLNRQNTSQTRPQNQNNTSVGTTNSPLAPNTGIFGGSTHGVMISSVVLVAALVGAVLVFRFFRQKKYRKAILPKVLSITVLSMLILGSSFSLVRALEKTINLDANILGTDKIAYIKDTITIPDATSKGFTLSIYHDATTPSDRLVNKLDNTYYLTSTAGTKDNPAPLTDKTYGVTLTDPTDNNNPVWFAPTADNTTSIYSTTEATPANHKIDIYYGVKAKDLKAGTYTGSFKYKITPNPSVVSRTIFDITKMQEMTPELCANTTTPYAYRDGAEHDSTFSNIVSEITHVHTTDRNKIPETALKDTRDNKTYVVRKLADGHCWMSQNLALSTTNGQVLTDADTDMNGGRTFTAPGVSAKGDVWDRFGADGPHYLKPEAGHEYYNDGVTPASTGSPTESTGNYYDWIMATAGARDSSGNSLVNAHSSGEAADSICPKGWRLPTQDGNVSYDNLLRAYNLMENPVYTYYNTGKKALTAPFNYVFAAAYAVFSGDFNFALGSGFLQTSSLNDQGISRMIRINNTRFFPHYNMGHSSAGNARCMAR